MQRQQPFRFLDLPFDVRSIIYGHVILHKSRKECPDPLGLGRIFDLGKFDQKCHEPGSTRSRTALLLVSRQVHNEATAELYGRSIFHFSDEPYDTDHLEIQEAVEDSILFPCSIIGLLPFLKMIGKQNRLKIRELTLELTTEVFFEWEVDEIRHVLGDAIELLSEAHSLRKLVLDLKDAAVSCFRELIHDLMHEEPRENKLADQFGALRGVQEVTVLQDCDPEERSFDSDSEAEWEDHEDSEGTYYSNRAQAPCSPKSRSAQLYKPKDLESANKSKPPTRALEILHKEEDEILEKLRDVRRRISDAEANLKTNH